LKFKALKYNALKGNIQPINQGNGRYFQTEMMFNFECMNLSRIVFLIISILFFGRVAYLQPDEYVKKSELINKTPKEIPTFQQAGYRVQERFKDMSSDSFEIRNFKINYRHNPKNALYGYDWKVEEMRPEGVLTLMFIPEGLFVMHNDGVVKEMTQTLLADQLDPGSYFEYLRSSFLLEEVVSPFISAPPEEISTRDSNSYIILFRKTSEDFTQKLILDKETYRPTEAITINYDDELGLQQVQQVYFSEYNQDLDLLNNIFSPEYYKNNGYSYKLLPVEKEEEEEINPIDVIKSRDLLFHYPFLNEKGDTILFDKNFAGYVLLDFWYAGCAPCLKGLPVVNTLLEKYPESTLKVVGINGFDLKNKAFVSAKLRDKGIKMELLFAEWKLIRDLKVNAFPAYMLITPDGKLEYLPGGAEDAIMTINSLLK